MENVDEGLILGSFEVDQYGVQISDRVGGEPPSRYSHISVETKLGKVCRKRVGSFITDFLFFVSIFPANLHFN